MLICTITTSGEANETHVITNEIIKLQRENIKLHITTEERDEVKHLTMGYCALV